MIAALLIAIVALGLAGYAAIRGYSSPSPTSKTFNMIAADIEGRDSFFPDTIVVNRGDSVTFIIENVEATEAHHIGIREFGQAAGSLFGVDESLPAGQTTTVTFTPDRTGTFEFYCELHAGMVGQLVVLG